MRADFPPPRPGQHAREPGDEKFHLFLLEVLVKGVSSHRATRLSRMSDLPTVVHFGFRGFPDEDDLNVTPVFSPVSGTYNTDYVEMFDAGKSVMFPVSHREVEDCAVDLTLRFRVMKKLPDDPAHRPSVQVGAGTLCLSEQYQTMRGEMLDWRLVPGKTDRELHAQVPLTCDDVEAGTLYLLVRLSTYGRTVVTEFSRPIAGDFAASPFNVAGTCDQIRMRVYRGPGAADSGEEMTLPSRNPPELFHPPEWDTGALASDLYEKRQVDDGTPNVNDSLSRSSSRSRFCKPVVLKVSGLFDDGDNGRKKPTVTVAAEPGAAGSPDAASSQHDIFVLRIGKKGLVGVNEKSDIQLEMKTPKGSERRPPIRYETRNIQTDPEEAEPPKNHVRRPEKKRHKKK